MCLHAIKVFLYVNIPCLRHPCYQSALNLVHGSRKGRWMDMRKVYRASNLPGLVVTCLLAQFWSFSVGTWEIERSTSSTVATFLRALLVAWISSAHFLLQRKQSFRGAHAQLFHCLYLEVKHLAKHFVYPTPSRQVPLTLLSLFSLFSNLECLLLIP